MKELKTKIEKNKVLIGIVVGIVILFLFMTWTKSNASSSSKRGRTSLLEQWKEVDSNFQKVIESLDDRSEGEVELRIIELDNDGFPKKYEFVGYKDRKEFLIYDEDGDLKE